MKFCTLYPSMYQFFNCFAFIIIVFIVIKLSQQVNYIKIFQIFPSFQSQTNRGSQLTFNIIEYIWYFEEAMHT